MPTPATSTRNVLIPTVFANVHLEATNRSLINDLMSRMAAEQSKAGTDFECCPFYLAIVFSGERKRCKINTEYETEMVQ